MHQYQVICEWENDNFFNTCEMVPLTPLRILTLAHMQLAQHSAPVIHRAQVRHVLPLEPYSRQGADPSLSFCIAASSHTPFQRLSVPKAPCGPDAAEKACLRKLAVAMTLDGFCRKERECKMLSLEVFHPVTLDVSASAWTMMSAHNTDKIFAVVIN